MLDVRLLYIHSDHRIKNDRENTRDASTNEQMKANQDNMKNLISVFDNMVKVCKYHFNCLVAKIYA